MEEGEIEQSDAEFTPESLNDSGISDFCTKSEDNTGQDVSFDEVWDDSELINQWNFTVENFRKNFKSEAFDDERSMKMPFPKWKRITRVNKATEKNADDISRKRQKNSTYLPQKSKSRENEWPKYADNSELQELLWAWYMAGYRTGFYEAKHFSA